MEQLSCNGVYGLGAEDYAQAYFYSMYHNYLDRCASELSALSMLDSIPEELCKAVPNTTKEYWEIVKKEFIVLCKKHNWTKSYSWTSR